MGEKKEKKFDSLKLYARYLHSLNEARFPMTNFLSFFYFVSCFRSIFSETYLSVLFPVQ